MLRHSVWLLIFLASRLAAQVISSSIVGDVLDSSGAAMPGVVVTVTSASTGAAREISTDATGAYVFPQLNPGLYQLTANHPGFKRYEVTNIVLLVSQTVRVDIRLQVGEVNEQVRVTAQAVQLEGETSSLGQVITEQNVVELPLNGRNFMQLANISPGVVPAYNGRSATITNQSGRSDMAVHISGGRGDTNSYLVDGVETRSSWFNSPSVLLSVDAIQEFKVDRNLFSAEYGQGSGLISLVSKSGGNAFHGTAYEFLRNDRLDAANFFDNYFAESQSSVPPEPIRRDSGRCDYSEPSVLLRELGIFTEPPKQHAERAGSHTGATERRPYRADVQQTRSRYRRCRDSGSLVRSALPGKSHSFVKNFECNEELHRLHTAAQCERRRQKLRYDAFNESG